MGLFSSSSKSTSTTNNSAFGQESGASAQDEGIALALNLNQGGGRIAWPGLYGAGGAPDPAPAVVINQTDQDAIEAGLEFAGEAGNASIAASDRAREDALAFGAGAFQEASATVNAALATGENALAEATALTDAALRHSLYETRQARQDALEFSGGVILQSFDQLDSSRELVAESTAAALAEARSARNDALQFAAGSVEAVGRIAHRNVDALSLQSARSIEAVQRQATSTLSFAGEVLAGIADSQDDTFEALAATQEAAIGVIAESAQSESARGVDNVLDLAKTAVLVIGAGVVAIAVFRGR